MMKNSKNGPVLAVVVPCYNEEEVLRESAAILHNFLQTQIDSAAVSEDSYILMDDGSKDRTWSEICALHDKDPMFRGLKLAHNRGHQNALYAGLMEARKDCDLSISIDADLQDDVESMAEMIRKALEKHHGNRKLAAEELGMSERTLYRKLPPEYRKK